MSDVERERQARRLFDATLAVDADQRSRLLDESCGDDGALRVEVERLLAAAASGDGARSDFLTRPARLLRGAAVVGDVAAALDRARTDETVSIAIHPRHVGRYRIVDVLGEGGMGIVYRAEQENPHRTVALKVLRRDLADPRRLRRFEQEAAILGLLHHRTIAQVFEAGTFESDDGPRPFFAMELVEGQYLTDYARTRRAGVRERVELLIELCRAVDHAHQRGVIHRDLKPTNVLVESGGQLKVLDFGVARLLEDPARSTVDCTLTGEFLGTLEYMSPEHFSRDPLALDTRSDVYSIGVIAFELLTGSLPYELGDRNVLSVLRVVCEVAPTRLGDSDRRLRGDLEIVVAKALEKDKEQRYASALALCSDLERVLRDEPILARLPSTIYQLRKFARRNKALTASAVALLLALTAGLAITTTLNESLRRSNAEIAVRAAPSVLELIEAEAEEAWPPWRDRVASFENLEARMSEFLHSRGALERALGELRAQGTRAAGPVVVRDDETLGREEERERQLAQRIAVLDEFLVARNCDEQPEPCAPWVSSREALIRERDALAVNVAYRQDAERERVAWAFDDPSRKALHDQLCAVLARAACLEDARVGLRRGAAVGSGGWSIATRLELARDLAERTVDSADAVRQWREAIASIADTIECPAYGGLRIEPHVGLLPLHRDAASGLWEFWDVLSGAAPLHRRSDGAWEIGNDTGIVLVLVPGADFVLGVQKTDPSAPNFDDTAQDGAATTIAHVDPFFISKYEMTQGQWMRIAGANPAVCWAGSDCEGVTATLSHPIENVTASDSARILRRVGLRLPSNEQWEFAARTSMRWGSDAGESNEGFGNFADQTARRAGFPETEPFDDGYAGHAPVGTYPPNPFGLHDALGNVYEFVASDRDALYRGGCFANLASRLTAAAGGSVAGKHGDWFGVRPARPLASATSQQADAR